MAELPFQISIINHRDKNKTEIVDCRELLRAIAGRREVYAGSWNGRGVILKVFLDKISSRRHLKREWGRLHVLQSRGVSCPQPLFFGRTKAGDWAMAVEQITDSKTALEVFEETADVNEKVDLLVLIVKELAKQHSKGVLQRDLHLGNFLLKAEDIFTIDPAQIGFCDGQVGRRKSVEQLALIACSLPRQECGSIERLCHVYSEQRGWGFDGVDEGLLKELMELQRCRGISRGLKKFMRTNRRHLRIERAGVTAMVDRGFCREAEAVDLINQIDSLMDSGQILKKGNSSYVSRINYNDKDVVVKRYNHKGIIHSLRHTIKGSRGKKNWLNGHRLAMLDISTAKPLAYIEQRKGAVLWQSYIVTEFIEGQNLYDFLRNENVGKERRSDVIWRIRDMFDSLNRYNISHSDLKHSNILIVADDPVMMDLDAMGVYKWKWLYKIRYARDIRRFEATDEDLGNL